MTPYYPPLRRACQERRRGERGEIRLKSVFLRSVSKSFDTLTQRPAQFYRAGLCVYNSGRLQHSAQQQPEEPFRRRMGQRKGDLSGGLGGGSANLP